MRLVSCYEFDLNMSDPPLKGHTLCTIHVLSLCLDYLLEVQF